MNNPHAFPTEYHDLATTEEGMTLRDYFAGQALAGILANPHNRREALITEMGEDSYRFADAMLAQREKG